MDPSQSTILITGGATGIGFALAERFVQSGSDVIIYFVDAVMLGIAKGEPEIGYGFSEKARRASREELDAMSLRFAR